MKRYNHLWPQLSSYRNLLRAAEKARVGKRKLGYVLRFHHDLEQQLCELEQQLRDKTYRPGPYKTFEIFEPKRRMISAAPYRDRVVHHALCGVLELIFERCFISDSYACRRGKGTHAAVERFTQFARRNRYVLKSDVKKFFPSIDHVILKQLLARKIKDPDVLWLIGLIIDHSNPQEPVLEWFPGDDLFTPSERRRGLPIGNQTSQFFANAYLNPFDHFVKQQLGARYYIRYVDDFVILHDDKRWLADARQRCGEFLAALRLKLHPHKSVISRTADGTRFLGYRVFPDHRLLARDNTVRLRRRLRKMQRQFAEGEISTAEIRQRLLSWIGHAQHADTYRLRGRVFSETKFVRRTPREFSG